MKPDERALAERAFLRFVELCQEGERPDLEVFLAEHEEPLRTPIRKLIEDYELLRQDQHTEARTAPLQFGPYLLERELGRGASAVVWEAIEEGLDRRVALKRLHPIFTFSRTALGRFLREARAAASLDHPGIVKAFATGAQDDMPFIAQELVAGGRTLAHWLDERRSRGDFGLDHYREVARICALVADALDHAHQAGIVHRDLKPSNVLLTREDMPKLADFGLALVTDDVSLSQSSSVVGTYAYMSPEQVRGAREEVDRRSDVFALGTVLYELLTGTRPFREQSALELRASLCEDRLRDPRDLRYDVPPALAAICIRALRLSPSSRYQDMASFAADLRAFRAGRPVSALPPGRAQRAWYAMIEHPRLTAAASLVAMTLVGSLALLAYVNDQRARADFDAQLSSELLMASDELHLSEHPEGIRGRLGPLADEVRARLDGSRRTLALEKLAHTARRWGDTATAIALLREVLHRHLLAGTESSPEAQEDRRMLGWCLALELRFEEAAETYETGLQLAEPGSLEGELLAASYLDTLLQGRLEDRMLDYLREHGDPAARLDALVERLETDLPEQRLLPVVVKSVLAALHQQRYEFPRATELIEECLEYCQASLSLDDPLRLRVLIAGAAIKGHMFSANRSPVENLESELRLATASLARRYGPSHPVTCLALFEHGRLYINVQDFEAAKPLYERARAGFDELAPDHLYSLLIRQHFLVAEIQESDDLDALDRSLERLARDFERSLGPQHSDTINCLRMWMETLALMGRWEKACEVYQEALGRFSNEILELGQVRVEYAELAVHDTWLQEWGWREWLVTECSHVEAALLALVEAQPEVFQRLPLQSQLGALGSAVRFLSSKGEDARLLGLVQNQEELVTRLTLETKSGFSALCLTTSLAHARSGALEEASSWLDRFRQAVESDPSFSIDCGDKGMALELCRRLDRRGVAERVLELPESPVPRTPPWSVVRERADEELEAEIALTRGWLGLRGDEADGESSAPSSAAAGGE